MLNLLNAFLNLTKLLYFSRLSLYPCSIYLDISYCTYLHVSTRALEQVMTTRLKYNKYTNKQVVLQQQQMVKDRLPIGEETYHAYCA